MGAAEVIAFEEVRARKQWSTLRQQLHERFDQWLDSLEQRWPEPPSTLTEVTATVWDLRQQLTGGSTETIVAQVHRREHDRTQVACSRCTGVLRARGLVCRTVETMVGPVQLERPGYPLKAGQLTYDCRYPTMHGVPVTGGHDFRGLKPLWYNGVPP
jgi:hypothetical protein